MRNFYHLQNNRSNKPFMTILMFKDQKGLHHCLVVDDLLLLFNIAIRWFRCLIKSKNNVFSCFQSFHKMICTQFYAKINILIIDNSTRDKFGTYAKSYEIIHQTNCPGYTKRSGRQE